MSDWKVIALTFLVVFLIVVFLSELFMWAVGR